ncbi:MAG: CotH kinase family protein [Flavobacteriales bacterium]
MKFGFIVFLFALSNCSFAQLIINEVCASNYKNLEVEGETPDWIELKNEGSMSIELEGYHIGDQSSVQNLFYFQELSLGAGETVLVYASGYPERSYLDAAFSLTSDGEIIVLLRPDDSVADQVEIPSLRADHSYGRTPEGWRYFTEPTPDAENNSSPYLGYTQKPTLNIGPGLFSGPQVLSAFSPEGNIEIEIGMHGEYPSNALLYTEPIAIDSTDIVQFRGVKPGYIPSKRVGGTYLIDPPHDLPIFSIYTPSENLFDEEFGIYELGLEADTFYPYLGANFWEPWDKIATMEYFENGQCVIHQDVEIQMHGGKAARTKPQKPIRITARDALGKEKLDHQFIKSKPTNSYKKLVLRNSGGDHNRLHFRDAYLHDLMIKEGLDIDLNGSQPSVVYLNGDYWGVLNIREKVGVSYVRENFELEDDVPLTILEEDSLVVEGTRDEFDELISWLQSTDFSIDANYQELQSKVDEKSFVDYIIAETYWNNTDWPANNLKYWKKEGGKWRYILFDLDVSLNTFGWVNEETDNLGRILEDFQDFRTVIVFSAFLEHPNFKHYFINRYADLMNTSFEKNHVAEDLLNYLDMVEPEMHRHFGKWGNSVFWWRLFDIEDLTLRYIFNRPEFARNYVEEQMEMDGQYHLDLSCIPPNAGTFDLNTLSRLSPSFSGTYFNGNSISCTAVPNEGFEFSHWQVIEGEIDKCSDEETETYERQSASFPWYSLLLLPLVGLRRLLK